MSTRILPARRLASVPAFLLTSLIGIVLAGCQEPVIGPVVAARVGPEANHAVPPIAQTLPASGERSVLLGKSVGGRELRMWVLGDGTGADANGPGGAPASAGTVFIVGGIHGDEPGGAALAQRFLEHLRANPDLVKGKRVAVLPRANPDGLAAKTRVNAGGVDVNRNFPASNRDANSAGRYSAGPAPASEPESKAIIQAVDTLSPSRIISIHAISGGRQCNNWDGPAEELARRMAARNGYPAKGAIGYPTPGSMGTWAGIDRKIPMITLELPEGLSAEDCWRDNQAALLEAIR